MTLPLFAFATANSVRERSKLCVQFGSTVRAVDIDDVLARGLRDVRFQNDLDLSLDLAATIFMEPSALQMLIATLRRLKEQGHKVSLRIPQNKKVRDFWKAWGFAQAVSDAIGVSLADLLPEENQYFWNERQTYYLPAQLPAAPGFPGDAIRSRNFFGFHTEKLGPSYSARLAYVEKDRWNLTNVQHILKRKLGKGSTYFPSRVVFEAILNAMRHPEASVVQIAASDQALRPGDHRNSFFTAHFWDDGTSMVDTLQRAINAGVAVRGEYDPEFDRRYLVVYSEDDEGPSEEISLETSRRDLVPGMPPHLVLFATLLPRVTSDPTGAGCMVAEEILAEDTRLGRPGMGLYVLLNAVVEVLGGSVAFRTGRYFMNVRKPNRMELRKHDAHMRVRIKRKPAILPEFLGNLIVVRVRASEEAPKKE